MHATRSSLDGMMARGSHYTPRAVRVQPKVHAAFKLDRSRLRQSLQARDLHKASPNSVPEQVVRQKPVTTTQSANTLARLHASASSHAAQDQMTHGKTVNNAKQFANNGHESFAQKLPAVVVQGAESTAMAVQSTSGHGIPTTCKYHKRSFRVMYIFGMLTFAVALFASAHTIYTNMQTKNQVQVLGEKTNTVDESGVVEGTSDEPAEDPVSERAMKAYSVDKTAIRYIRIPSQRITARVKASGLDRKGAVEAPRNIHDVNWYNGSVVPGSSVGTSLLVGHLSGWTAPGVFKKLDKLKSGDVIELERGDGQKLTYAVDHTEKIPVEDVDMSKILATDIADTHMLKLMTCAGAYDSKSDSFKERTIVYATFTE